MKDTVERDGVFSIDGQKRHAELVAEVADGIPGEEIAIAFLRRAQMRVRMDSSTEKEQRQAVGLGKTERSLPVGLECVLVRVSEDKVF